jgi:predicted nucleotidyltransferase
MPARPARKLTLNLFEARELIELIERTAAELEAASARGVFVFGSAMRGPFGPHSDFDVPNSVHPLSARR